MLNPQHVDQFAMTQAYHHQEFQQRDENQRKIYLYLCKIFFDAAQI
jgi:hypothetical protein